jgi:hypothetical protein
MTEILIRRSFETGVWMRGKGVRFQLGLGRQGRSATVRRTGWYTTPRRDWRVQYPFGGTGMFKEGDIQEADQHRL